MELRSKTNKIVRRRAQCTLEDGRQMNQITKGADGSSSKEGKSERKDNIKMESENKGCQQGTDAENKGCFGKAQQYHH